MDGSGADCFCPPGMTRLVTLPLWLFVLILLFAAVTALTHLLVPSVRWFLRRRAEHAVAELNKRLARPIQPFKMARRTDTIQRLIYDPGVVAAVAEHAAETGVREDVAFETARGYAREIVPGFSAFAYFSVAIRAARWLATRLYEVRVVKPDGPALPQDATVIYVMNHRSNIDYVLVTWLVAREAALSYAVGEWARIWPLNWLIRALGGYFIRRRSRGQLYRRVLARYVRMATDAGTTQALFPEGGLTRTGRLQRPKVGILSYVMGSESRDVIFVPVALSYERVIEDRILIEAAERGDTRYRGTIPQAAAFGLRWLWRRWRRRTGRFGLAAVSFGRPLSLKNEAQGMSPDDLAAALMRRIAEAMPLLPVPMLARVLVEAGEPVDEARLRDRWTEALARVRAEGRVTVTDGDDGGAFDRALSDLRLRRIVTETGAVVPRPGKAPLLAFYAAMADPDAGAETERRRRAGLRVAAT